MLRLSPCQRGAYDQAEAKEQAMANVAEKVGTESNWIDGAATPTRSVRWALASLSLATLLSSLGTSIASVGLPSLMQAFGAS
ncbi:hypothetical protein EN751_42075, partial [Mesorhizobium sp. M4A.F.Ca.ET.029.04.2.1]